MTDEYLIEIGKLTVKYQFLEFHIKWLMEYFNKKSEKKSEMVTSEMKFWQLLKFLDTLNKSENTDLKKQKQLNLLITEAKKLSDLRNELIHSLWLTDIISGKVQREQISKKKGKERINVSLQDLKQNNDEIEKVVIKFVNLHVQFLTSK